MGTRGLKIAVVLLGVLGLPAGCHVPPVAASAQAGQTPDEASAESEAYLMRKLAGQERPTAPDERPPGQGATYGGRSSAVRQASATEPAGVPAGADPALQNLGTSLNGVKPAKPTGEDQDSGFDWSSLDPQNVYKKVKNAMGYGPNEALAHALFDEGKALYGQRRFGEAAKKFKTAADRWPDSPLEEDSLFYEAESYFFDDRYAKSHDAFLMLFKKYPNSRYLDVAAARQFAIGRYWELTDRASSHWPVTPNFFDKTRPLFDTFGNGMNAYDSVRINDPSGPLADASLMATGNAYFAKGRFEEASYKYDLLRKEYPKSQYQVPAHVLDLQCKRRMYQGALYDATPLMDEDEIAKQALTQFRGQLGDEYDNMAQARVQVREQKADRDYAAAQYYERKKAYGAAKIYYRGILKDFPATHVAQAARERLEAIKDKPDNPPNHFKWLTSLFDTSK